MLRAALRWLPGVLVAALFLFHPRPSLAQLRTCVEVVAPERESEALARLLRTEIDRHPTHRSATSECQGTLTVELVELGPQERWLTGRINTQVPQREKIGPDGIAPAVERLLTVVLHNDPLVLHGPQSPSWLARQKRALETQSLTHFGLEVFESGALMDASSLDTLAGLALAVRREVSAFYVGARVAGAFNPGANARALHLGEQVEAQVEATVYFDPPAATSLFLGGLVGLLYQRFHGPAPLDGEGATGTATSAGLSLGLRAGVEAFRTSNVHALLFLQLEAPAFVSRDPDHGVVDRWVPSATVGAGWLF